MLMSIILLILYKSFVVKSTLQLKKDLKQYDKTILIKIDHGS